MGRAGKAKAEEDLVGSPAKRGVGRSGKGATRTVAPKELAPSEPKKAGTLREARSSGRKTSTGSNADTSKALSALEQLLRDKKEKAAAAEAERSEAESSDESDEEVQKNEKDGEIAEKINNIKQAMNGLKGGEDDTAALPKWGQIAFRRLGPIEHGKKLDNVLESVAPEDGSIWSEVLLVLREMEESSTDAKQEVVKALLTGGGLRTYLFDQPSVDLKTLRWLFDLVCYFEEDVVERAAFSLLADLLSGGMKPAALAGVSDAYLTGSACGASFLDRQDGKSPSLDWVPTLRDFREVFDAYGYLEEAAADDSDKEGEAGPSGKGDDELLQPLPANICSVLRLVTVCAAARSTKGTFSAADTEGLLSLLAHSSLDHQLYFAMEPLQAACEALTDSFTDAEWATVGPRLTNKLAKLSDRYINNVHIALSWPCASSRSLDLQRSLAYKVLANMFRKTNAEKSVRGVVSLFKAVSFKDADCVPLLSQLRLADVFLRHLPALAGDLASAGKWIQVLKAVQGGVKHIDPRPGAADVRQLASFALTKYENEVEKLTNPTNA